MGKLKIAVLKGDGIGPEIVDSALEVLTALVSRYKFEYEIKDGLIGGIAIDKTGNPLPEETINICKNADAVFLGAVGGPKWDDLPTHQKPEKGLLGIRKVLDLYANLRPAKVFDALIDSSPLKNEIVKGTDLMVVRELSADVYYGEPRGIKIIENDEKYGFNTMGYKESEIRRVVKIAFEIAKLRRKKLTSVDKANVLEVSGLWREIVNEEHKNYPDIEVEHLYVDNCAMQLVNRPSSFDTIVTGNIFGDILSDEAGVVQGSLGMLPSASLGDKYALYEPIHGSAPDIAGKGIANPIATILSLAMMFKYTFKMEEVAKNIEDAVDKTLSQGYRTADIYRGVGQKVDTEQMTKKIIENL